MDNFSELYSEPKLVRPSQADLAVPEQSGNRLYKAYEPRELRQTAGTSCKYMALYFLWRDVVKSIVVRHPDAKAVITLSINRPGSGDPFGGKFSIKADDTRNPGEPVGEGFRMPWTCDDWPGKKAARLFFVAAWATYLAHEGTELVSNAVDSGTTRPYGYTYPDSERVFNVHDTWDHPHTDEELELICDHWIRMNACHAGRASHRCSMRNEPAGQVVLESILGAAKAKEVWEAGMAEGKKELAALEKELEGCLT